MGPDYDILIAGGGMVGASLALALAGRGMRSAVVEAVSPGHDRQPSYDDRGLALSLSSRRIFESMGLWQQAVAGANPIRRVHVSDRGHFGKVRIDAASLGLEALGHVVIARELGRVLWSRIEQAADVDLLCPATVTKVTRAPGSVQLTLATDTGRSRVAGRLLVVADGTRSAIREQLGFDAAITDYHQTAIVTNVTPKRPHEDTAYERFTTCGPLALLPLPENRCVVVLTVARNEAENFMALSGEAFVAEVLRRFGIRLGPMERPGKRHCYQILGLQAREQVMDRVVLLGNSAHTLHPNGAQGFNLCLRDVAGLAEHLIMGHRQGIDAGNRALLDAYQLSRRADQARVSRQSHGMTEWFYNDRALRVLARNTAMTIVDLIAPFRIALAARGMGIHGKQPAPVRGLEI